MLVSAESFSLSGGAQLRGEKISYNSKSVLLGLFALVGIILLIYTISIISQPPEQTGRLNTVFIAAISGSLALGGTLISQLWGKPGSSRPIIIDTDPVHNAVKVNSGKRITVGFNKLMNEQTINQNTFTLEDDKGAVLGTVKVEGGRAVFEPVEPLKADTTYRASITKNAKDTTGNSLEADKVWLFSTGEKIIEPSPIESTAEAEWTTKPTAKDKEMKTTMNQRVEISLEAINPDPT